MNLDEVRAMLDVDEPDYPGFLRRLDAEDVASLRALVSEDEPRIASKAAYLASLLPEAGSAAVVDLAGQSRHPVVRVAAASGLAALDAASARPIAQRLLTDVDPGVRARAMRSVISLDDEGLRADVARRATDDDHPDVRALAADLTAEPR
jgi:HEAT repeat protein